MLSCILIHGSFDHSVGPFPALDNGLDVLHCLRREVLLAGFPAHSAGIHVFNNEDLTIIFQCVGYVLSLHRFRLLHTISWINAFIR